MTSYAQIPELGRQHLDLAGQVARPASLCPTADRAERGLCLAVRAIERRYAGAHCAVWAGIPFRTSAQFPNANDASIKEIWHSDAFNWYRRMHLKGRGPSARPATAARPGWPAPRDWKYGWLNVLKKSGDHLKEVMKRDLAVEVELYEPKATMVG